MMVSESLGLYFWFLLCFSNNSTPLLLLHISAVLDRYELRERLDLLMKDIDVNDLDDLANRGRQARLMIINAGLPDEVIKQIEHSYDAISDRCDSHSCAVAVRSSATAEDLPTASFAGQQSSFLNVVGKHSVCNGEWYL